MASTPRRGRPGDRRSRCGHTRGPAAGGSRSPSTIPDGGTSAGPRSCGRWCVPRCGRVARPRRSGAARPRPGPLWRAGRRRDERGQTAYLIGREHRLVLIIGCDGDGRTASAAIGGLGGNVLFTAPRASLEKPRATLIGNEQRTCRRSGGAVPGGTACPAGSASCPLRRA